MMILEPSTGHHFEVVIPTQVLTPRLEERADVKAARSAEKQEQRRAAAWAALRQAEFDDGPL